MLRDPTLDGSGLAALAEAGLADESERKLDFFATVASHQPALWPLGVARADDWSLAEWKRRLKALKPPLSDEAASWLVENTPIPAMKELVGLLVGREADNATLHLELLGERLKEHLQEIADFETEDERSENESSEASEDEAPESLDLLAVLPWQAAKEEQGRERINSLLGSALEHSDQAKLVAHAYNANKITAEIAVELIPEDCEEKALQSLTAGSSRRRLCQDHLVELLEEIGTADDLPLLEAVMADTHQKATARRVRAADRVGQLIPARGPVPAALVELLNSNKPELRAAAIRNIERVKPRDAQVIAQLRAVARAAASPATSATRP